MELKGKVAIVTGASSGVGSDTAHQLAQHGARVVINYAKSKAGAEATLQRVTEAGGDGLVVQADVSDDSQCRAVVNAAIEAYGQLDVLVNNAGTTTYVEHKALDLLTDDIWHDTLNTNLLGPFYMTRAAAPHLAQSGGGEVVMTSSVAAFTTGGSSIAYGASKAGLNSLTQHLARALGEQNIRVNAVCPGLLDGSWAREGWGDAWETVKASVEERAALGKMACPNDVADAILSLITGSDLVTGQLLTLDAGFSIR